MANTPVNKELYTRVKAEAKRKFKSWPSAYGSAWLVKEYKKRGGKYTTSKRDGGMSSSALSSMQSFYKDMQANKYNPSLQNSLDEMTRLAALNPTTTYLNKVESGTGETLYKGPGLFSQDPYVLDKNINIQTHVGPQGERLYKNIYELDQDGFSTTSNLGYSADTPEGTRYMMDMNGNDYSVKPPEMKKGGGIPERYKNMGFTKVGVKKQSTRPGKKWMVLAKKGDDYKVVHGGDSSMKDFSQHGSEKRKDNFWNRMGGRDSAKAKDPFSPLYWHKKFSTWQEGGQFIYDPNNPMPQFEMGNSILDKMKRETMRKGGQPCYECGGMYAAGGTNNPGFEALPPQVQQKIRANMNSGGMTPFNANPNYYGERLEKFIGNVRDTAANNLFPDMEEEVMQMPQARYGMPIYQTAGNIDNINDPTANLISAPLFVYDKNGNRVDKKNLTYGSAIFDHYGNLLGGYYRDNKMHARRPNETYTMPGSDQTVTIGQNNELIYNSANTNTTPATETNNYQGINWLPNEPGQNQNDETRMPYRYPSSDPTPPQAPSRPTIAQRWEQATGMPWSQARSLGLTDGDPINNQELISRIEAGETIPDIKASMQETIPEVISNNNVNGSVDEVVPETLDDTSADELASESADELASESIDYNQGNQGMYTDPNTGMVMNVPQQYFGQQFMQESPEVGMYPQYGNPYLQNGNPYLQRAQYKYGLFGLGKNLRKVDLQFGMPGQNIDTTSITPDNTGDILKQAGVRPRDIRKAQRQAKQSQKTFNKFVNKHGSPERVIESMPEGSMRGTDRNALMRAMENQGVKPNSTEGQRFEGYDLIQLPSGEYEYRPQAKYGGNNPYLYMYKEGGEYYMDENTINMIMAMGGDIEFLD
jgi:hypothetical protein